MLKLVHDAPILSGSGLLTFYQNAFLFEDMLAFVFPLICFVKTAPVKLRFHGKVYTIEDSVDECEEKGGEQMAINYILVFNLIQSKTFQNVSKKFNRYY